MVTILVKPTVDHKHIARQFLIFYKFLDELSENPVVLDFVDQNVPGTKDVFLDDVELWAEAISLDKILCPKRYLFFTDVLSLALADGFEIQRHRFTGSLIQSYEAFSADARFPINIDLFI